MNGILAALDTCFDHALTGAIWYAHHFTYSWIPQQRKMTIGG